jgi:hypothetical protein
MVAAVAEVSPPAALSVGLLHDARRTNAMNDKNLVINFNLFL